MKLAIIVLLNICLIISIGGQFVNVGGGYGNGGFGGGGFGSGGFGGGGFSLRPLKNFFRPMFLRPIQRAPRIITRPLSPPKPIIQTFPQSHGNTLRPSFSSPSTQFGVQSFHSVGRNNVNSGEFHEWNGHQYVVSWRKGLDTFTWEQAKEYCASRKMTIISLDYDEKTKEFLNLIERENVPYIWTGGTISGDKRTLSWPSGRTENIKKGTYPWSGSGLRGSQPDGVNSEGCLAVLNNFYNDGVTFHDVGCSHKKPTICE